MRRLDIAAQRCGVYVVDVEPAVGNVLPERYRPRGWETNKFSAEMWLRRAVDDHPWRVRHPSQADVVLLSANFSLYCRSGKSFTGRSVWKGLVHLLGDPAGSSADCKGCKPIQGLRSGTAKFITLTNNECKAPWTGAVRPKRIFAVTDQKPGSFGVLAPFVVAQPAWLTAPTSGALRAAMSLSAAGPRRVPWAERELLFFLGHVPKLYIEPTRYRIWRQVRRLPNVTALSGTLNCSVGQFSACRVVDRLSDEQLQTYCHDYCRAHAEEGASVKRVEEAGKLARKLGKRDGTSPASTPVRMRCKSRSSLRRYCKSHAGVDFASELPDMAAAARKLPQHEYYQLAMGHRFCLSAPGDFVSTPKITEFVALGAAGGCLPVLVIRGEAHNTLPYMRWLDWCQIGYLVNASRAIRHMDDVVGALRAVTATEAAAKYAALRGVVDAFVWRPPAPRPLEAPSAPDFILAEACASWRRFQRVANGSGVGRPGPGRRLGAKSRSNSKPPRAEHEYVDVRRCML